MGIDYNVVLVTYADTSFDPEVWEFPEMRFDDDLAEKWGPYLKREFEEEMETPITFNAEYGKATYFTGDGKPFATAVVVPMARVDNWWQG